MTKLKDGPGEENNPIVQYQEWADHRYDPGRWLGGNVPPATRSLWAISKKQKRWLGLAYIFMGFIGLYRVFSVKDADSFGVFSMVFWLAVMCLLPGAAIYFGNRIAKGRKVRTESEQQAAPHRKHHGHGSFSGH